MTYSKSAMPDWPDRKPSIVFESEEIQSTYESLKDRGAEFTDVRRKMPWGTYAGFRDTDDNEFLLKGP